MPDAVGGRQVDRGTAVDVEVVVWSANVLPSDPSGSYDPVSFNDPHKFQLCEFLAGYGTLGTVTLVCPSTAGREEGERERHGFRTLRIQVPLVRLSSAVLWFNLRLALRVLRSGWHVAYFFDDGKAIPFVVPLLLSRIRGFPVVLDYRNPPVFHRIADVRTPRQLVAYVAEKLAYRLATLAIALSPTCSKILSESYGGTPWVVPSAVSPLFQRTPAVVLGPGGQIRFVYWGSITKARRLEDLILGFLDACHEDPATPRELVLVGEGDEKARLEDLVRRQDGAPVRFHPWQTREALQEILAQATVAVVAIPPDIEQYVASSPLKLAEALALGRPILASELPATDLVRERGVGIQARHERGAYASAIRAFDRDSIERFVATRASSPDLGQANLPPAVFAPVAEWIGGRRSPRTSRGAAVQTP